MKKDRVSSEFKKCWAAQNGKEPSALTLYLTNLAPSGRRSMRSLLQKAMDILHLEGPLERMPWGTIKYRDIMEVRAELLKRKKSANTINMTLAAFQGVSKTAFLIGQLPADELCRIKTVPRVRSKRMPAGHSLRRREVVALLGVCRRANTRWGVRDGAIMALMLYAGLRRNEVVALDVDDYESRTGMLRVRSGKGDREREVVLPNPARQRLGVWLRMRKKSAGALFCPILKNGVINRRKLSTQALYSMVRTRSVEAKIKVCTPHDLRRTFVTGLLDNGVDLNTARLLAGHENVETTARYDRRPERVQRRAVKRLVF